MKRWIPVTAVVGLVCLMIIPTPGILGICIGAVCLLAIIATIFVHLLDKASTRILTWHEARRKRRRWSHRRVIHAQSGMVRKA